jgi:hypothetical protein
LRISQNARVELRRAMRALEEAQDLEEAVEVAMPSLMFVLAVLNRPEIQAVPIDPEVH